MVTAPDIEAIVPHKVTPPDVPTGTTFPVVMRQGERGLKTPSSVAQVSALTAAMLPKKPAKKRSVGRKK